MGCVRSTTVQFITVIGIRNQGLGLGFNPSKTYKIHKDKLNVPPDSIEFIIKQSCQSRIEILNYGELSEPSRGLSQAMKNIY